ncbi:hypothetical protein [Halorussus lipolyticus]|uniref:hypothetical protein n=1 Tax=Halorussus lipolyticus TaxID=3034024 RepID=UPI0023E8B745|nr:hypothetical protein [Halorussus sp. DT80]
METESTTGDASNEDTADETVRVWLVQRTYSDDEQNIVILVYATPDGRRYLRKERALTSFGDDRPTTAAVEASSDSLGTVDDPETRERYAEEAARVADEHAPDDRL